jgi:hypothetical protein
MSCHTQLIAIGSHANLLRVMEQGSGRHGIIVAHSRLDATIPFEDSERLVRDLGGPPRVKLEEVENDGEFPECSYRAESPEVT